MKSKETNQIPEEKEPFKMTIDWIIHQICKKTTCLSDLLEKKPKKGEK